MIAFAVTALLAFGLGLWLGWLCWGIDLNRWRKVAADRHRALVAARDRAGRVSDERETLRVRVARALAVLSGKDER